MILFWCNYHLELSGTCFNVLFFVEVLLCWHVVSGKGFSFSSGRLKQNPVCCFGHGTQFTSGCLKYIWWKLMLI